jgi:hypothetical protein
LGKSFSFSRLSLRSLAKRRGVGATGVNFRGEAQKQLINTQTRGEEKMNIVSKKLHALERNVLPELPEKGTTKKTWENGDVELDRAENQLHRRATQILEVHAEEMQQALDQGDDTFIPLLPSDQAIVEAANRRFVARIFDIFRSSQMLL